MVGGLIYGLMMRKQVSTHYASYHFTPRLDLSTNVGITDRAQLAHMMTKVDYNRLRLNEDEKHENNRSNHQHSPCYLLVAIDALKNVSALQNITFTEQLTDADIVICLDTELPENFNCADKNPISVTDIALSNLLNSNISN